MSPAVPTVSVIIPNYNYEKTIGMCLTAVFAQTHAPAEVIVVDDGSTDGSVAIAETFPCKVITSSRNSGVAAARNLGAAAATGEILFFLDSDVVLREDALAEAVELLRADPNLGAVCGIYTKTPLIRDSKIEEYRSLQAYYWRKSSVGPVSVGFFSLGAVWRRVYDDMGPFNERLWQTEEVDYGYRLSRRYGLELSDRIVGAHDDDDALVPLMRKLARRARLRVPLYLQRRRFMTGFETRERSLGVLAAAALPVALGVTAFTPWAAVLAVLAFLAFLACDRGMYAFVLRDRGLLFAGYFVAVHYVVMLAVGCGVTAGIAQYAVSQRFRGLYAAPPPSLAS